ncbi:hypothetical protein B0H16DRAFT_1693817 [Mycena metata]|uniref:Uncharacterized protein n=1 Tax=Mycena metata TaxID=1033252 RepID=A0AAD7IG17_9AGAR|nr:hypothetical protein B0H16DRAFT_1693817 [Mycena metata]
MPGWRPLWETKKLGCAGSGMDVSESTCKEGEEQLARRIAVIVISTTVDHGGRRSRTGGEMKRARSRDAGTDMVERSKRRLAIDGPGGPVRRAGDGQGVYIFDILTQFKVYQEISAPGGANVNGFPHEVRDSKKLFKNREIFTAPVADLYPTRRSRKI